METAIWFAWAFLCAWVPRFTVVALLFRRFDGWSYLLGYLVWGVLFSIGIWMVGLSGFQMYGFDPHDPWQKFGEVVFFLSPFGLPILIGAPAVLLLDFMTVCWRTWRRPAAKRP
jgi:hypothetical protein